MKVEQIYTGCLAEAAYYIESAGEVAIIDPLRETAPYLQRAAKDGAAIRYIFETHFHADFVSGHKELAAKTGATIVYGPNAECDFDFHQAHDGELFKLGNITITALHTPGHTLESTTYLLQNEAGEPYCIFSGDTLFINDVGRPDLAAKSALTKEDLAGLLYDSLHTKILPLPDSVIVYPAHGAGSACGKNLSKDTFDTLGHQRTVNYALQAGNKEAFIKQVTDGLAAAPSYFPLNVLLNKHGADSLDEVLKSGVIGWTPDEFEGLANTLDALVLDVRPPQAFATGFIPGSVNIGLDGQFAPWIATLNPDLKQTLLLICEKGREEEAVTRLARVGFDNTVGFLEGGIESWKAAGKDVDTIKSITAEDFEQNYYNAEIEILDVRKAGEYEPAHLVNGINRPLDFINEWTGSVEKEHTYYIHCAGGYRSMIAASILKKRGIHQVVDIQGGFGAISKTTLPVTAGISSCNS
jgi:hydroxyacylglutathione hydrolase